MSLKNERRRLQGYRQALECAGIAVDEDLIWHGNLRPEEVAALCRERLSDAASRPDACSAPTDRRRSACCARFASCGLETPRDIGFVTFDELTVDDLFTPSITTIVQPAYEIGFRAGEILLDRIEGAATQDSPITVRLPATLKIRASSNRR